ncbi:conserved hypothetical protein [Trichinella spiralis]|uniref:hypothetical protein n=1 Tax=Trichinella spiralis TaxID=6334 RepID=UPI0001EFDA47|nr:conserved hypothetical protein [Trichinella spiralis]
MHEGNSSDGRVRRRHRPLQQPRPQLEPLVDLFCWPVYQCFRGTARPFRQTEASTTEQLWRPTNEIFCFRYGVTTDYQVVNIHACLDLIHDGTETVTLLT